MFQYELKRCQQVAKCGISTPHLRQADSLAQARDRNIWRLDQTCGRLGKLGRMCVKVGRTNETFHR